MNTKDGNLIEIDLTLAKTIRALEKFSNKAGCAVEN
jgi:hypothetical protein